LKPRLVESYPYSLQQEHYLFKRFHPEMAVAVASAAWGLFWIPLRAFYNNGLTGSHAVLAQFLIPLLILTLVALFRIGQRKPVGIGHWRTGILVGSAVALYLESLLFTEVARSLILFYLMPVWATLLEVLIMHQRLCRKRRISLGLGLLGLSVMLFDVRILSISLNFGDMLALLSGILFSFGALEVRKAQEVSVFEQLSAFFLFSSLASLVFVLVPTALPASPPSLPQLLRLIPWLVLTGGLLIPIMGGIYWGSRQVDPGRLGILLQVESVVGILSAALLAGEPFGLRQTAGSILVIGAGFTEVASRQDTPG
jgi:drug/metabolite transporter (DMT)-like permease